MNSVECPICMDNIETTTRNCVTTECGHCFHTNCLMTSVAHNGFGCPYCRTKMAEEVAEDEENEYEYDDDIDDESDEVYGTYVLRGFRFFNNIINNEEHEDEDLDDEDELEEYIAELEEANANTVNAAVPQEEEEAVKPPLSHITQKLVDQGVTMEALVKVLLMNLDEYDRDYEDFERVENEMCGRVRTILNNYTPPPV